MRSLLVALLVVLQMMVSGSQVALAAFASTTVKVSVDEAFWDQYHLVNPSSVSGDVEKIYKIKKVEVRLMAGDREFGAHTFTREDNKPQKFELLHGVSATLMVRIKSSAADNVIWMSSYPFKDTGDDIVIKAIPASVTLNYPGL